MADIEATIRTAARHKLEPWFTIHEEVPARLRDGNPGFLDLLAIPRDSRFSAFSFAIEVKARPAMVGAGLAAWIKQTSDYVGSQPAGDMPPVSSGFLWMVGMAEPSNREDEVRLRAMIDVAHQFRVGVIRARAKGGFIFQMGPDELFRSAGWPGDGRPNDPWPGRALERLTSRRQSAGVRRTGPIAEGAQWERSGKLGNDGC